jgi:hypothetical protein
MSAPTAFSSFEEFMSVSEPTGSQLIYRPKCEMKLPEPVINEREASTFTVAGFVRVRLNRSEMVAGCFA